MLGASFNYDGFRGIVCLWNKVYIKVIKFLRRYWLHISNSKDYSCLLPHATWSRMQLYETRHPNYHVVIKIHVLICMYFENVNLLCVYIQMVRKMQLSSKQRSKNNFTVKTIYIFISYRILTSFSLLLYMIEEL